MVPKHFLKKEQQTYFEHLFLHRVQRSVKIELHVQTCLESANIFFLQCNKATKCNRLGPKR